MKRNRFGPVAVSVGALLAWSVAASAAETTASGPQLAQASGNTSGGSTGRGAPETDVQRPDGSSQGGSSIGTDQRPGGNAQMGSQTDAKRQQRFTQDLEGEDVVDTGGKKIGTVSSVVGNRLIVSSGGLLGIGDRKVALGPSQVTLSGDGAERRIIASVSRDQLDNMPEYDGSADAPDRSQAPASPSTPSGTSGAPR